MDRWLSESFAPKIEIRQEEQTMKDNRRKHSPSFKARVALEALKVYVEDLKSVLADSPLTERRAFIKSFAKEIRVDRREATIEYTLPMLPTKVECEKVGVLPITVWWAASDSSRTFI